MKVVMAVDILNPSKSLYSLNLALKICTSLVSCILQNYLVCFLLPVECELIFALDVRTSFSFCKFGQKAKVVPVHLVTYMLVVDVWGNSLCYKVSPESEKPWITLRSGPQAGENSFKALVSYLVGFVCFKCKLFGVELSTCKCQSVCSWMFPIFPLKFHILSTIDNDNLFRNTFCILFQNTSWICNTS